METKKVLAIIFSIVFVLAFGFVLAWGIINFNKVKEGISGTELYTYEDIKNSYQDGYDTALSDKEEYEKLINSYRDTITTQTDEISKLNSQVSTLTNSNKEKEQSIINLQKQKETLQIQVDNLSSLTSKNDTIISELNTQITNLENEVDFLKTSEQDRTEEIASKNEQIATLQSINLQLQKTNELNANTITSLNVQIVDLNKQISDYSLAISNNSGTINALNAKISDLEKSVAYYEQYIANLENGEQVVATFEFDGSVYNVQVLNKGDVASVVNPNSTDYVVFNGWTVNGEMVDLSNYVINTNTKFVADITYKYQVLFNVDSIEYDTQFIEFEAIASNPENPTKAGYEFDGWTINGVDIINIDEYPIIENTTFVAKFTQLHEVVFMVDDEVYEIQHVRNGSYAALPVEPVKDEYMFDGWLLNGTLVDVSGSTVIASTIYVAKFTELKGLHDSETGELLYSFDKLIEDGYFTMNNKDYLTANDSASTLSGDLTLPDRVKGISNMTKFTGLRNIWIPSSVTYISRAFTNCVNLVGVFFEENSSLETIVYEAFSGCSSLEYFEVPSSVISVGYNAFNGCYKLFKTYDNAYYVGNKENPYFILSSAISSDITTCEINSNVRHIAGQAFYYCGELTTITNIKNCTNLITLGSSTFRGCEKLTSLNLRNCVGIKSIRNYTFYACKSLTSLLLPAELEEIEHSAFSFCTKLTSLYIPETVVTCDWASYQICSGCSYADLVIYCGASSRPSGWGAKWNLYVNSSYFTTKWGYTYEQYLAAIGA